jgi:hypothetical protein
MTHAAENIPSGLESCRRRRAKQKGTVLERQKLLEIITCAIEFYNNPCIGKNLVICMNFFAAHNDNLSAVFSISPEQADRKVHHESA